jgi:hypothetical protein
MPCAGRLDQANVMIFGQSAGSASVSLHTTLPASWPYFAKAGMASGEVRTARPPALPAERQRARRLSESPGGGGAAQYATWNAATWADRVAVFPDFALPAMAKELGCSLVSGDLVETCFLAASTSALLQVLITLLICCAVRGVKRWSSTSCFLASALPQVADRSAPTEFLNGSYTRISDTSVTNQFKGAPPFSPTIDCVEIMEASWYQLAKGVVFPGPVLLGSNHGPGRPGRSSALSVSL